MVKVVNGKLQVVGVHRGVIENKYNCGSLLTAIISHWYFGDDGGQLNIKAYHNCAPCSKICGLP